MSGPHEQSQVEAMNWFKQLARFLYVVAESQSPSVADAERWQAEARRIASEGFSMTGKPEVTQ